MGLSPDPALTDALGALTWPFQMWCTELQQTTALLIILCRGGIDFTCRRLAPSRAAASQLRTMESCTA